MKQQMTHRVAVVTLACLTSLAWGGAWAYTRTGPVPKMLSVKAPAPMWTEADVDRLVETQVIEVDAQDKASVFGAPLACDKIKVMRMRLRGADPDASQADAAVLLVPGILEGAGAFHHVGRHLVYLAKTQRQRSLQVWAMDRRANCLEDKTGIEAAEQAPNLRAAEDLLIGYYYRGARIDGKQFGGFLRPSQTRYLSEFGMAQTTRDMRTVIQHFVPSPEVSKRKVFVGGHSLGGIHTSAFLSWDFDGNPQTLDDAGYNLVAGAIGMDTIITSLSEVPAILGKLSPLALKLVDGAYPKVLSALREGVLPAQTFVPGLIGPEVLALPTALGVFASKGPHEESLALKKLGRLSPELQGFTRLLNARDGANLVFAPYLQDYRFTTTALIGAAFSKQFTPLGFLQTGLGFMKGGPMVKKTLTGGALKGVPLIGNALGAAFGLVPSWAPADAGRRPFLSSESDGPLYDWADRDEVGAHPDDRLTDASGRTTFTSLASNPAKMSNFVKALHAPLDLTEWYFPLRIALDSVAMADPATAVKQGLNVFYPQAPRQVPSLLILGDEGLVAQGSLGPLVPPQANVVMARGFAHLDPMFVSAESPSQVDYVMKPMLDFMFQHAH